MSNPSDCSMSFPSEKIYKEFDKELLSTLFYPRICEKIDSLKSDSKYVELCYKVVQYLIVNASDNNEKLSCNQCNLLNYWVFDKIKSIIGEDTHKIIVAYGHIRHVLSKMMKTYYKSKKIKCTFDINVPYYKNWEAKKELYEYCLDYEEIKAKKILTDPECNKYRDYLKKKPHLLANFEQIIADNKLKKCPNSDAETGGCDPKVLLAELLQKKNIPETKNDLPDDSSKLFLGLSKKDTATAASVAGVSLLGLTLFKLTPLGTWMNRGKQETNNVIYNLGENNTNELFPNGLQPPNMEYDNVAYHLPYNSA
ncbi:PIR protein [Plasmodium vivax]|uniref:VIR protein n=1 Tax=Plasmodium vivax TaxID=5855 RepID=A0A565A5U3_PLAVI|nr:PIR protein [Plasmodium vivax]